jgi:tetratricopeptide (TPR) repeat protein
VPIEATPVAQAPPATPAHEIDISNEWEEMIEVEPVELPVQPAHGDAAEPPVRVSEIELEPAAPVQAAEAAEAAEVNVASQIADKVQEIRFYITQEMWEPAKAAILDLTELAPDAPEVTELIAAVSAGQSKGAGAAAQREATPVFIEEPAPASAEPERPPIIEPVPAAKEKKRQPTREPAAAMAQEAVQEDVLEIAEPPKAKPSPAPPAVSAKEKSTEDILGDFVLDLEQSEELADFVPKPRPAPAPAPAAAAAPAAAPAPAAATDRRSVAPKSNGDMQDAESANALSDILSELRDETAEAAEPEEDPETHYNLGIAFKEMGLLDEAIGELQKVCHAVDRGAPFSQPIQALTWLAQCLVDKGAPEAAVRWYQKALQLHGLDDGSRCAIYYDLAMAYEASGDKKSALTNFMEVYGSNIDFRDVASRIKALKS